MMEACVPGKRLPRQGYGLLNFWRRACVPGTRLSRQGYGLLNVWRRACVPGTRLPRQGYGLLGVRRRASVPGTLLPCQNYGLPTIWTWACQGYGLPTVWTRACQVNVCLASVTAYQLSEQELPRLMSVLSGLRPTHCLNKSLPGKRLPCQRYALPTVWTRACQLNVWLLGLRPTYCMNKSLPGKHLPCQRYGIPTVWTRASQANVCLASVRAYPLFEGDLETEGEYLLVSSFQDSRYGKTFPVSTPTGIPKKDPGPSKAKPSPAVF